MFRSVYARVGFSCALVVALLLVALDYLWLDHPGDLVIPLVITWFAASAALSLLLVGALAPLKASLRRIAVAAAGLAEGRLAQRVDQEVVPEARDLAVAVNHMAQSLERQVQTSNQERDTFGTVIETMADALLVVTREGVISLLNRPAAQLFKVDPAFAIGRLVIEVVRDHEIVAVFRRSVESGRQESGQVEDADQRMLYVVATPIEEVGQSSILVIVQDLTNLQRLQGMRREFVANVSHELRTPLASIKASVEALQAGAIDERDLAQDFLRRVNIEVDALTEMVQRLTDLSRVETGKAGFTLEPLNVGSVADHVVDRLQPQTAKLGLRLMSTIPGELPLVAADRQAVTEILINLLGNSLKFTSPGGRVTVSATQNDSSIEVVVTDTGIGISQDHLSHIFERFYKVDRSRSTPGIGLGLALAKHLVQAQGGRIWAESDPGKGAAFYFTLPFALEHSPRIARP